MKLLIPIAETFCTDNDPTSKKTLMSLPDEILSEIFYLALPTPDSALQRSIASPKTIIRRHAAPCAPPATLYLNRRSHILAQNIWLNNGFTHIYLNSWNTIPDTILRVCTNLRFLTLTLDIRSGARGYNEGLLRPTVFCAKIRDLLARLPNVQALFLRCWHGKNAINPVSRIVMNAFTGFKVEMVVNVTSMVNAEDPLDRVRGSGVLLPSALTTGYLRLLLGEMLDRDPKSFDRKRIFRACMKKSKVVMISSAVAERHPGCLEAQMAMMDLVADSSASGDDEGGSVGGASTVKEDGPTGEASAVAEDENGKGEDREMKVSEE